MYFIERVARATNVGVGKGEKRSSDVTEGKKRSNGNGKGNDCTTTRPPPPPPYPPPEWSTRASLQSVMKGAMKGHVPSWRGKDEVMNNVDIIGEIHLMHARGAVKGNGKGVALNDVTIDGDGHIRVRRARGLHENAMDGKGNATKGNGTDEVIDDADIIGEVHLRRTSPIVKGDGKGVEDEAMETRRLLNKVFSKWAIHTYHRLPPQDERPVGIEDDEMTDEAADAPEGTDKGNGMNGKGKGVARDDGKRTVMHDKRIITDNLDEPGARRTRFCLCVCWNSLMEILGRGVNPEPTQLKPRVRSHRVRLGTGCLDGPP
jgi:hypothetical protein